MSIEEHVMIYDFVVYMNLAKFSIKHLIRSMQLEFMLHSWYGCF